MGGDYPQHEPLTGRMTKFIVQMASPTNESKKINDFEDMEFDEDPMMSPPHQNHTFLQNSISESVDNLPREALGVDFDNSRYTVQNEMMMGVESDNGGYHPATALTN